MAKERITVTVADVKMNLSTADPDTVKRMAASLNARIKKLSARARCTKNEALLLLIMEQAEAQKKTAELIHAQQEQIFSLLAKNASLMGQADESAPYVLHENALLRENIALQRQVKELLDEIIELREQK
ncbi:MAG: hypothetical protein IKB34_07185 [Clostridia bacterium]|nr:hypothetical protein [Clostridia bacterium]